MADGTCALCGATFTRPASGGVKLYCSRQCTRRVANAKRRGTTPRQPIRSFRCETCGLACVPGENVANHAARFCGKECKRRWHHEFGSNEPSAERLERERVARRRNAAQKRASAARRGTIGVGRWAGHTCSECGTTYIGRLNQSDSRARNVYCGPTCKNRYFARVRRAQLRNVGMGDPVRRHEIYERDGYRCQLCNKPVKRDAVVPHPKAPVLDHIIPLGKNGTHEPANVQLAHFMCNSIKSDNIGGAGDQLRLIG